MVDSGDSIDLQLWTLENGDAQPYACLFGKQSQQYLMLPPPSAYQLCQGNLSNFTENLQ
jgi:hypothetical protein